MNKITLALLVTLFIGLMSCKKKDDIEPIPTTSLNTERYMPLAIGNVWNYSSKSHGDYSITVKETQTVDGFEFFVLENSDASVKNSMMNYEGNKLYTSVSVMQGKELRVLILDEDAKAGDKWNAGTFVQNSPGQYACTTIYTCELVAQHNTYSVGDKTYDDVLEVNMNTEINLVLDPAITAGIPAELLKNMEDQFKAVFEDFKITQRTFYARNIGFIYQYSNDVPELGAELLSYEVK